METVNLGPHYVILSVDTTPDANHDHAALQPPKVGVWTQTEGDEQYEFDYLGEEYKNGRHRKWVATLSEEEFDAWLSAEAYTGRVHARESGEPTMGMITEFGWLPAYSLTDEQGAWNLGGWDPVILRNAYVGEYALATSDQVPADVQRELATLYGMEE